LNVNPNKQLAIIIKVFFMIQMSWYSIVKTAKNVKGYTALRKRLFSLYFPINRRTTFYLL